MMLNEHDIAMGNVFTDIFDTVKSTGADIISQAPQIYEAKKEREALQKQNEAVHVQEVARIKAETDALKAKLLAQEKQRANSVAVKTGTKPPSDFMSFLNDNAAAIGIGIAVVGLIIRFKGK